MEGNELTLYMHQALRLSTEPSPLEFTTMPYPGIENAIMSEPAESNICEKMMPIELGFKKRTHKVELLASPATSPRVATIHRAFNYYDLSKHQSSNPLASALGAREFVWVTLRPAAQGIMVRAHLQSGPGAQYSMSIDGVAES